MIKTWGCSLGLGRRARFPVGQISEVQKSTLGFLGVRLDLSPISVELGVG